MEFIKGDTRSLDCSSYKHIRGLWEPLDYKYKYNWAILALNLPVAQPCVP